MDCDKDCNGCNGGDRGKGLNYFKSNAAVKGADYPYTAETQICKDSLYEGEVKIMNYVHVEPTQSEVALVAAISQQVVTVGVEADKKVF